MADSNQQPPSNNNTDDDHYMFSQEHQQAIIAHVGNLSEGYQVATRIVDDATLQEYRARFTMRRALANLSLYPEGFVFMWQIGGERREVLLLTPPDHIAELREDGTIHRRRRTTGDGPAPYDLDFYRQYVLTNGLPSWFLSAAHIAMLSDDGEAQCLGLDGSMGPLTQPPANYLEARYDEQPQYLFPGIGGSSTTYSAELDASLIHRMARRFPAVIANARTFGNYRIFVLPSGHIFVRRTVKDAEVTEPHVPQAQLPWVPEADAAYLASYSIEGHRVARPASSNQNRQPERDAARARNGWVDQDEHPRGLGRLEWLNAELDSVIARNLGYDTPDQVLEARRNGDLANVPFNNRPITVWWPDDRFLNPPTQPEGTGRWEYITTPSETQAHTNLGDQDDFPLTPYPTAAQIFTLRRNRMRAGRADPTQGIDIVWIPTGPIPRRQQPRSPSPPAEDGTGEVDQNTGIVHDPNNRGENDQTGIFGQRTYQTIKINGRTFTVDRSRAHANEIQPWKSWAVTSKGRWYQWKGYSKIDWTDDDSVEKMNKWREQALARIGFYNKRPEKRPPYIYEERKWLFGYVKKAKGLRSSTNMAELTRLFNERFGDRIGARDEGGIQSLYDRLRDEYRDNNGEMKPEKPQKPQKSDKSQKPGKLSKNPSKTTEIEKDDEEDEKYLEEKKEDGSDEVDDDDDNEYQEE